QIEKTAKICFEQVQSDWQLDKKQDLKLIKWAIKLHEIGMAIAHGQYHKHGAYLLKYSDMPGFSRYSQAELAMLVLSHRRKFPLAEIQSMPEENIDRILRLCIIVRFSILMHRSRSSDSLPKFKLKAGNTYLKIIFPENWLNDHPLTEIDLETEAAYVSTTGIKLKIR
ncbi:MAG: exopolyphosphatase, partial [Gammaproteobacteria bacterium]